MTVTTTIKLSDDLKERVTSATAAASKTSHAWMVEAIEAQAALAQRRQAFVASVLNAEQEVTQYGLVYDADEVFSYILAKAEASARSSRNPASCSGILTRLVLAPGALRDIERLADFLIEQDAHAAAAAARILTEGLVCQDMATFRPL